MVPTATPGFRDFLGTQDREVYRALKDLRGPGVILARADPTQRGPRVTGESPDWKGSLVFQDCKEFKDLLDTAVLLASQAGLAFPV